jgi:hypothetical protein
LLVRVGDTRHRRVLRFTIVTPDEQLLIQALRDQFAVNLGVNLLNDDLATNIAFSPLFVDAVEQLRSAQFISPIDERELSRIVADECIARLLHVNPYLEVTDTDVAALAAIYRSSYAMIRSGEPTISAIGGHHCLALQGWIAALYPKRLREALRGSSKIGSLAYSQYSAELQLRTLRIDADTIEGRVLDIGCGPTAVLVHHLRLLGQDAWGIDRNVIRSTPYLKAANWLDFLYPRRSYGLIASHLAFSSHFLYHISSESEHVPRYRAAYQNIVDALTPAGSFRYVPSLPEMESSLPSELYGVSRWKVSARVSATAVTRIAP